MKMEAISKPIKPGLFATLAAHEIAQSASNKRCEPTHGLRPRLRNPFESLDLDPDSRPLEEQVETLTPLQAAQPGNREAGLAANGLQPLMAAPVRENPSQPANRLQPRLDTQSAEHESSQNTRPADDPMPSDRPPASWILETPRLQGSLEPSRLPTAPAQPQLSHDLLPEKMITERVNTVERETVHEIRPVGLFARTSAQSAGVTPRLVPTQALMPQAEKSPEPTIEIHIGRIEVRAQIQTTPPKPEKAPAPGAENGSLQAYLRARSRGARS